MGVIFQTLKFSKRRTIISEKITKVKRVNKSVAQLTLKFKFISKQGYRS